MMRESLLRNVRHNLGTKLISLALAMGLWLAVAQDPITEKAIEVPIEFHSIPKNLEVSSDNVSRAKVTFRGPQRVLRRLQAGDVRAELELKGLEAGEHTFDLTSHQVHQPGNLEVVQIVPNQIHLSFRARTPAE
ncbi:MAG: CdaR family protein [Acidobacteriaceae bacterium]